MISVLALLVPAFPRFSLKFVPLENAYSRPSVVDARADLSASGSTYVDMIDSHPKQPLLVWKGKQRTLPLWREEQVFSGAFTDESSSDGDVLVGDKVTFLRLDLSGKGVKVAKTNVKPSLTKGGLEATWSQGDQEADRLVAAYASSAKLKVFEGYCSWLSYPSKGAWQLRSVKYFPVVEGYEDIQLHDTERFLPIVKVGRVNRLLSECVEDTGRDDYQDIAWVPRHGDWFVTMGSRDRKFGMFWFFPHPTGSK